MVKARFTVTRFEVSSIGRNVPDGAGGHRQERQEMRTVVMHPVYSNDPNDPNKKFWDATPSGELKLGTVNRDAWSQFELDRVYELTFTPVPPA